MKNVSMKKIFSTLWNELLRDLGWLLGLFGYRRDGKFARCVGGLLAVSGAVILASVAVYLVLSIYEEVGDEFFYYRDVESYISRDVTMHDDGDGNVWIMNELTGKKTLNGVAWIAMPLGEKDSLVAYSDGRRRGYFNKYTGEVAIPARYRHAWVFSDGIAGVEENGEVAFVDAKGNQVFSRTFAYDPNHDGYVFHGGYCIVDEDKDGKCGLINTQGITVLPEEYDQIEHHGPSCCWVLTKGDESGVVDRGLKAVLPMMKCDISVFDDGFGVTMPDNTLRMYDLQGVLVNGFCVADFAYLEYELEEVYGHYSQGEYEEYEEVYEYSEVHKKERARLCKYTAGRNMEGLMTQDGRMVTLPKYESVAAVGRDAYLCTVSNGYKVILDGKGREVNER